MARLTVKIETANGIYTIKRPTERHGARHIAIITSAASMNSEKLPKPKKGQKKQIPKMSPADQERLTKAFEDWASQVLPHIVQDGPFTYAEMPGEDQYAIFLAMMNETTMSEDLFRIVD